MEIVSCVVGLASLTIEVATVTTRYINGVKSAPQEIIDLSIQTKALSNVLERLEAFLQNDVEDRVLFQPESSLSLVLEHCRVQLEGLSKQLEVLNRPDKGKLSYSLDKLKWPLNRKQCLETARRLHEYTQTFHFCLSLNHWLVSSYTILQPIASIRSDNLLIIYTANKCPKLPSLSRIR